MTGPQLKALRSERGMNQIELAKFLGDCTNATISRWEASDSDVPSWVSDKMLASSSITIPLPMLHQLMEHATRHSMDFQQLLSSAIQDYLAAQAPLKPPVKYIYEPFPVMKVADEPLEPRPFPINPPPD